MSVFEQVRKSISVVDLLKSKGYSIKSVGSTLTLEKCPFCDGHDCFRIYEQATRWSCFQCPDRKVAKDVVDLEYYFLGAESFSSALKSLSSTLGLEFHADELESVVVEIKEEATKYYEYILETKGTKDNRVFPFKGENLSGSTWDFLTALRKHEANCIKAFRLGLSDGMVSEYLQTRFKMKEVRASGLMKEERDQFPDGMIMYPQLVGGRVSHFTCKDPTKKYKPFQSESRFRSNHWRFYNQDVLLDSEEKTAFLVEGENDLISTVWKGGVLPTIGMIGNISEEQIKALQDLSKAGWSLVMAFDGDEQGKKYRNTVIKQVGGAIFDIAVSDKGIPEGKDIDDLLCQSENPAELMKSLLENVVDDPKIYAVKELPTASKVNKTVATDEEKVPHSLEQEKFILKSIIKGIELETVFGRMTVDWFYKSLYGKIFKELKELYEIDKTVNELVVLTTLKDKGVGSEAELKEILDFEFESDIDSSLDILEKKYRRRIFLKFGVDVQHEITNSAKPVEEIEEDISNRFFNLYKTLDSKSLEINTSNILDLKLANPISFKIVGTPYSDINVSLVIGFDHGKNVVIAGRPGMGKSVFKTNLKMYWCSQNIGVLDFSPENGVKTEQARNDAYLTKLSFNKIWKRVNGDATDIYCKEIHKKMVEQRWPLWQFEELEKFNLGYIGRKVRQAKKERPDVEKWVVIADLANKIAEYDSGRDLWRSVGIANRKMKILSTTLGFCFVAVVQIGRGAEHDKNISKRRPELHDLKGSGNWEEDADLIFLLFREKYYDSTIGTDVLEVSLKKQRGGPPGEFKKLFGGEFIRIQDYETFESIEELPPDT